MKNAGSKLQCEQSRADLDVLAIREAGAEIKCLNEWIKDMQSGLYINCVYCGHRYGPRESTPISMADVLKEHIEQCPKHPMSHLKSQLAAEKERVKVLVPSDEVIEMLEVLWLDGDACSCTDQNVPCYECRVFMTDGAEKICPCVAHKIHAYMEKVTAAKAALETEGSQG